MQKSINLSWRLCLLPQIDLLIRLWWSNNRSSFLRRLTLRAILLWRDILFKEKHKTENPFNLHILFSNFKSNSNWWINTFTDQRLTLNQRHAMQQLTGNRSNLETWGAITNYSNKFYLESSSSWSEICWSVRLEAFTCRRICFRLLHAVVCLDPWLNKEGFWKS